MSRVRTVGVMGVVGGVALVAAACFPAPVLFITGTAVGNGTRSYSGDGGAATSAQLYQPQDLAVDAAGNLYIADSANQRIRKVDTAGIITTVVGSGNRGYYGDGGPATSAFLNVPQRIELTSGGVLVIADRNNNVVRAVAPDGIIRTIAGDGAAGFAGDGAVPSEARFDFPADVAVDSNGVVYIADERNDRVRKLYPGGGAVGGRVVADDGGAPAGKLTVNLYEASDLLTPLATTTTNANGLYGFSVLVGDYTVEVEGGGGFAGEWFLDASDGPSATTIVVTEGDQERADLQLGAEPF